MYDGMFVGFTFHSCPKCALNIKLVEQRKYLIDCIQRDTTDIGLLNICQHISSGDFDRDPCLATLKELERETKIGRVIPLIQRCTMMADMFASRGIRAQHVSDLFLRKVEELEAKNLPKRALVQLYQTVGNAEVYLCMQRMIYAIEIVPMSSTRLEDSHVEEHIHVLLDIQGLLEWVDHSNAGTKTTKKKLGKIINDCATILEKNFAVYIKRLIMKVKLQFFVPDYQKLPIYSLYDADTDEIQSADSYVGNTEKPICFSKDYKKFQLVEQAIKQNSISEPYLSGKWNKTAYPRRAYEVIPVYEPARDLPLEYHHECFKLLSSAKTVDCSQDTAICGALCRYETETGEFVDAPVCKANKLACGAAPLTEKDGLILGKDVVESDVWGFDCHTRSNIQAVLKVAAGFESLDQQALYVKTLLSVVNCQPAHRAYNIRFSLCSILNCFPNPRKIHWDHARYYTQIDDESVHMQVNTIISQTDLTEKLLEKATLSMLFSSRNWGLSEFRIHPKGVGVISKSSIVKSGTFITNYVGEVFPPWRWHEKQELVKKTQTKLHFKPILPDFYNIMLERDNDDPEGYGIAFIDPTTRGSYASRLSHSCEANCATVVMVADGKYTVSMYAIRDIQFGDELTHDYSSVTDDNTECVRATCLCGAVLCRGSFLDYIGVEALNTIISDKHTILHRIAMTVKSIKVQKIHPVDLELLSRHGIKDVVLHGLPAWLVNWAAHALKFAVDEEKQLSNLLLNDKARYPCRKQAEDEAHGVYQNRKQNLVICLSTLRHYLNTMVDSSNVKPAKLTSRKVILGELWNNDGSLIENLLMTVIKLINGFLVSNGTQDYWEILLKVFKDLLRMQQENRNLSNISEFKSILFVVRNFFWAIRQNQNAVKFNFQMAGDILTMILFTKTYFTPTQLSPVRSTFKTNIRNMDIGRDGSVLESVNGKTSSMLEHPHGSVEETINKLAAPYWYKGTVDAVTLSLCKQSHFVNVSIAVTNGLVSNFKFDARDHSEFESYQTLSIPMVGCFAVFVYEDLKGISCFSQVEPQVTSHDWNCTGIFYSFSAHLPGLTCLEAPAFGGRCFDIFVFKDSFFKTAVTISEKQNYRCEIDEEIGGDSVDPMRIICSENMEYRPTFMWEQLTTWFRQDPCIESDDLFTKSSVLCMPLLVESCMSDAAPKYNSNKLTGFMKSQVKDQWSESIHGFQYQHEPLIFGSPFFDDLMHSGNCLLQCRTAIENASKCLLPNLDLEITEKLPAWFVAEFETMNSVFPEIPDVFINEIVYELIEMVAASPSERNQAGISNQMDLGVACEKSVLSLFLPPEQIGHNPPFSRPGLFSDPRLVESCLNLFNSRMIPEPPFRLVELDGENAVIFPDPIVDQYKSMLFNSEGTDIFPSPQSPDINGIVESVPDSISKVTSNLKASPVEFFFKWLKFTTLKKFPSFGKPKIHRREHSKKRKKRKNESVLKTDAQNKKVKGDPTEAMREFVLKTFDGHSFHADNMFMLQTNCVYVVEWGNLGSNECYTKFTQKKFICAVPCDAVLVMMLRQENVVIRSTLIDTRLQLKVVGHGANGTEYDKTKWGDCLEDMIHAIYESCAGRVLGFPWHSRLIQSRLLEIFPDLRKTFKFIHRREEIMTSELSQQVEEIKILGSD